MPGAASQIGGWQFTGASLLGGFLFGVGTAINGACAYSTMSRLMDGEVPMVVCIGGFAIGVFTFLALVDLEWLTRPTRALALLGAVLTFGLLGLAIYEAQRAWRNRPEYLDLTDLILSPNKRVVFRDDIYRAELQSVRSMLSSHLLDARQ